MNVDEAPTGETHDVEYEAYLKEQLETARAATKEIKEALDEILKERFAHCMVISVLPAKTKDGTPAPDNEAMAFVRSLHFGGVNPALTHMLCVKALLSFGHDNFDQSQISPDVIKDIFGVKIQTSNGGRPGQILVP